MKAYLQAIRAISGDLTREIEGLSVASWEGPTNCPPWTVRDLATHLVTSGQGFVASIRRGLAGSTEPSPRPDADSSLDDPSSVARALSRVTDEFESLYEGLTEQQLELICFHRRGNRSVRWYAAHRLAEVSFHRWDFDVSLGHTPRFDESVARLLLPTLLESNVPRTYAAGLSQQRGAGERYRLAVANEPSLRWSIVIDPDELRVARGEQPTDVTIEAPAATLALLVYGRASVWDSNIRTVGDAACIERFAKVFPRP